MQQEKQQQTSSPTTNVKNERKVQRQQEQIRIKQAKDKIPPSPSHTQQENALLKNPTSHASEKKYNK